MNDTDSDVVAITQLVNLYGLAVDSQRWELFDRIFATDVDADYGPASRWTKSASATAVGAWCARPLAATRSGWHRLVRRRAIPGVKFDLATSVLRREADAGHVGILAGPAG